MLNKMRKACIPLMLNKYSRKYFIADFWMEIYIMVQSALLPVFINLMMMNYEDRNYRGMVIFTIIWFVLTAVFIAVRYRFDILVNGKFNFLVIENVRESCIHRLYDSYMVQIDKNYDGNEAYSFLADRVSTLVDILFWLNHILADAVVFAALAIWCISIGGLVSPVIILGSILQLVIGVCRSEEINKHNEHLFKLKSGIIGAIRNLFSGTESYLVSERYDSGVRSIDGSYSEYIKESKKNSFKQAQRSNFMSITDALVYVMLLLSSYYFIQEDTTRIIVTLFFVYNTMKAYMNGITSRVLGIKDNSYVLDKYMKYVESRDEHIEECEEGHVFEADNISYRVDDQVILDNINFCMSKNTKVALIGKNGSGKTTFLRILLCLLSPSEGRVSKRPGEVYSYIPVSPQLFPVSIHENISYGHDADSDINIHKIEELADLTGLGDERLTEILPDGDENLSGGEAQRVAIGRALISDSDILIADEPTSSLDPVTSINVFENLIQKASSILYTTHNPELLKYADLIYIMEKGRIITSGSYETIRSTGSYKEWENEVIHNAAGIS